MSKIEKEPLDIIKEMSLDLKLNFEQQDWGIINANPAKFKDFLDYYNKQKKLEYTKKYYLGELIIASFNELLICDGFQISYQEVEQFKEFISELNLPLLTDYWKDLDESNEFKVQTYIKQALYRE